MKLHTMKLYTYLIVGLFAAQAHMHVAHAQTTVNTLMKCTTTPSDAGEYSKLRIFKNVKDQLQALRIDFKKDAPPQKHVSDTVESFFDSPVVLAEDDRASDPRAAMLAAIAGIVLKLIDQNGDLEQMRKISRVKFGNAVFSEQTSPLHVAFALIEIFDPNDKSLGTVIIDEKGHMSACR